MVSELPSQVEWRWQFGDFLVGHRGKTYLGEDAVELLKRPSAFGARAPSNLRSPAECAQLARNVMLLSRQRPVARRLTRAY
jgi:hypothetical protein